MICKKSKSIIADSVRIGGAWWVLEQDAIKAVESAEKEAHERAIKAYCSVCAVPGCPGGGCAADCLDGTGSLGVFIKTLDDAGE